MRLEADELRCLTAGNLMEMMLTAPQSALPSLSLFRIDHHRHGDGEFAAYDEPQRSNPGEGRRQLELGLVIQVVG